MNTRIRKNIFGFASCGLLALLLVGSGLLAVWGYLSGPGGHPSNGVLAVIWIVLAATFVAPAGAIIGIIGLIIRRRWTPTLSAKPLLVGSVGNSVVFAVGLYWYLSLLHRI